MTTNEKIQYIGIIQRRIGEESHAERSHRGGGQPRRSPQRKHGVTTLTKCCGVHEFLSNYEEAIRTCCHGLSDLGVRERKATDNKYPISTAFYIDIKEI